MKILTDYQNKHREALAGVMKRKLKSLWRSALWRRLESGGWRHRREKHRNGGGSFRHASKCGWRRSSKMPTHRRRRLAENGSRTIHSYDLSAGVASPAKPRRQPRHRRKAGPSAGNGDWLSSARSSDSTVFYRPLPRRSGESGSGSSEAQPLRLAVFEMAYPR